MLRVWDDHTGEQTNRKGKRFMEYEKGIAQCRFCESKDQSILTDNNEPNPMYNMHCGNDTVCDTNSGWHSTRGAAREAWNELQRKPHMEFKCSIHGIQDRECIHVTSIVNNVDEKYCFACYILMLRKTCRKLEEVPE